jgi:hypothetical protein
VPSVWFLQRSNAPAAPVAAANAEPVGSIIEDPLAADSPFLEGPTSPPNPAVAKIAVPTTASGQQVQGNAVYQTNVGAGADTCSSELQFNVTLTIKNLNNGREVVCVNRAPEILPEGETVKLSTEQFLVIAELVDSPVPVLITWK